MENPKGLYDLTELTRMYRGDMVKVRRTVTVFREGLANEVESLLQAWLTKDATRLHNQLHKMRPNAQLLSAKTLLHFLDVVSVASKANDEFGVEMGINRVRREATALQEALSDV